MPNYFKRLSLSLLTLFVISCSTNPKQEAPVIDINDPGSSSSVSVIKPRAEVSKPIVVAGLQQNAAELNRKGESAKAASILERALRIQPRNPKLWHELANVRYTQERYQQAESLALRSNQYALRDPGIQHANWVLIARARQKQGDSSGAAEARKQVQKLQRR